MGALCVFGVSRSVCLAEATKTVPEYVVVDGARQYLAFEQWVAKRNAKADALFQTTTKLVKISPEFDAPQFCRDWLAVAPDEVRLTEIRVRGAKTGKDGEHVLRLGKPVITWIAYDEAAAHSDITRAITT